MGHQVTRAELGSVWLRPRVLGRPGHALAGADPGAHAFPAATHHIAALQALTAAIDAEARDRPWFGAIPDAVRFDPGRIRGGDGRGPVPSWCGLDRRLSAMPGQALADVRARVPAAVGACARGLGAPAPAVLGAPLEEVRMTAPSGGRIDGHCQGIPTRVHGATGRGLHSPDEAVELESLRHTTEVIALLVAERCGLRPLQRASAAVGRLSAEM